MKNASMLFFALLGTAGCATIGAVPSNQTVDSSSPSAASPTPAPIPATSPDPNLPRLVIPATGGAPTMAIPLGGTLYLPVTGGPPVVGIPITP
jgi:hypothetical protein